MGKIKICVLMGGRTPEYEISLATGREVVKNLHPGKYQVQPVVVSRDGRRWELTSSAKLLSDSPGGEKSLIHNFLGSRQMRNIDVVFITMHGPYGEDGTIQGMLELVGIPYTGSGVLASALGMDKIMFRKIMEQEKIPSPRYLVFNKKDSPALIWKFFNKPCVFVKPYNQGSSVGVSLVTEKSQLKKALDLAFGYSNPVLVEEYLEGMEVSCGILGNEDHQALPVAEIIPKNPFFDYEAKYTPGRSEEIVPARIPQALTRKVQATALRVFRAIGARGFARVDMIIVKNKPVVLEINTIPGLTPVSILPKEAQSAGISYQALLEKIIHLALESKQSLKLDTPI